MKTNTFYKTLLLLLLMVGSLNVVRAAATVNIPTTSGQYISWNDAVIAGSGSVENDGANIGSTKKNTVVTFTINNTVAQDYVLTFATGTQNAAKMQVELTNSSSETVLTKNIEIPYTGSWTPTTTNNILLSDLPVGTYTLTMKSNDNTNSGYFGNWGKLTFYTTSSYDTAPGTIHVANGTHSGCKVEGGGNVGYVSNNTSATYNFICTDPGVYKMTIPMSKYGDGTITTTVVDSENGQEASTVWTMVDASNYENKDILIEGKLTAGIKTMNMAFATTSSYLLNYKDFTMTRVYDDIAAVSAVSIDEQTVTTGAKSDWYCALPAGYGATTTFGVTHTNGTIAVSAVDGSSNAVAVTDNGDGTYTIDTPAMGTTTTVTLTQTANDDCYAPKKYYTFQILHIGEMSLTAVNVDGKAVDVLDAINASPYSATYNGCYTTAPTVTATQIDDAPATVDAPTISGSTYTYTIHGSMAGETITRDYTLVLDNVHVFAPTGSEETVDIKANGGTIESNTWTNGVYTLATTSLDSYNQYFKMNGNSYTISVPADVVVKQVIMKDCSNNYAGNDARLTAVSSTGATAYVPVENKYYHDSERARHDIIVNLDNHTAGTDIVLTQPKSGQPMAWIQLTIEKQAITTAPVVTGQQVTVVNNHAVAALTFDREMTTTTATINGGTVTAEGGSATLYFPIWNLDYSRSYTLAIAAGAAQDTYGNSNAEAINIAVNTAAKPDVEKAVFDYVVSTADELKAAISAIDATNTSASAARKVIFLKNGTYDLGSTGTNTVQWVNAHNISFIGESKDGVVICGTSSDISNPVLNIRYGSGQYLQDLTVRNLTDFDKSTPVGVSVAVYGGNKAVFRNVAMQAQQDTHVTGERAYYIGCQFFGSVDFICGGGDHFFDQCQFVITNSGYITAPSTNSANKWGYVMQNCTIDKYVGSYTYEADGNFSLGRPWQNEPRNYWLNTRMNVKPSSNGWGSMGTLPTHFYEYNSTDSKGNAIDLSSRGNSPSSTNKYTPVLTAEEAAKFTVENVLGGTDSWLPTEECVVLSAPTSLSMTGTTLSWAAVDDARCYVVFKDGAYYRNLTATTLDLTETGVYTVKAANLNGGLGAASDGLTFVEMDEAADYTPVAATLATVKLTRSIKAGKWSTICLPFDMTAEQVTTTFGTGVKLAAVSSYDSGNKVLSTVTATTIKANEPCFIKVASDFSSATISGVTIVDATPEKVISGEFKMVGTYASGLIPSDAYFVSNNQLFKSNGTDNIKPFRAYFAHVPAGARLVFFDDETTGISAELNDKAEMTNDNTFFDLQGRRVTQPTKGLYILNGRKVVIK